MNSHLEAALTKITQLDSWDIGSILGAVNYLLKQTALNATVRLLPDLPPEGSGLEYFAQFEAKKNNPQIRERVAPIIGMADRVTDLIENYATTPVSQYEDVLKFMTERPPTKAAFEADYNNRKRMGLKPAVSVKEFVEMEYAQALQRHSVLVARGELACNVLHGIEGTDGVEGMGTDLPDWLYEAIDNKILDKLDQRWKRAELRRTNPRISASQRDEAEANQKLLTSVILELGGKVPVDATVPTADETEEFNEFIEKTKTTLTGLGPLDLKKDNGRTHR